MARTAEEKRLEEARREIASWKRWGPYLSERQWGTVREDYSEDGNAWEYFRHGEDWKEYYVYLDSTPTHSYMKYLYKYPQRAYPYHQIVVTNRQRSRHDQEY